MGALFIAYGNISKFVTGKALPDVVYKIHPVLGIDYTTFLARGEDFSLKTLRHIVKSAFEDAEELIRDLMFDFDVKAYLPTKIEEDSSNSMDLYCWLSDSRNKKLLEGVAAFRKYFGVRPEFFVVGQTVNRLALTSWLRKSVKLLQLIVFLFHVTTGQPGRATENVKTLYRNTCKNRRHMLFHHFEMLFLPSNLKPESASQKIKKVLRFPCPRLAQILVIYLAFIREFEGYVESP